MLCRAEAAIGDEDTVGAALDIALEQHPDDARLLTLAAMRHDILGDPEEAETLFFNALKHADAADHRVIRAFAAVHYQNRGRFSEAADQFAEVVGDVASHPASIDLLACLVNARRLREALDWARRIQEAHEQPPRMVLEVQAQILEYVGDVGAAVSRHKELCSRTDATPADLVRLALAHLRCGERDAALKTVVGVNASEICADPRLILKLAQLKQLLGVTGHVDDAYLARRCGIDDPEVHLGYFTLFRGRDKAWAEPETVEPGCAVLLKNESGEQWWRIIHKGEESYGSYELSPTRDLARQLLGRRAGDTIVLRRDLEDLSYEIAAVQSKFVRAYQETVHEFSTRFPEHTGLSRVSIKDDDLTKLFQSIDQRHQFADKVDQLYREGRLPFASLASLLGRSALEVWYVCTKDDSTRIRFGTGADASNEASDPLREADGVVLDLLALLTVHELGLAEHLKSRFPASPCPSTCSTNSSTLPTRQRSMDLPSAAWARMLKGGTR